LGSPFAGSFAICFGLLPSGAMRQMPVLLVPVA